MTDIKIKIDKKTEKNFVRRFRVKLTTEQIQYYKENIIGQNELFNFALSYLYKHFGYKKLGSYFPKKDVEKRILRNKIKEQFAKEKYGLDRWNVKKIGLHSQAADQFLNNMLTNFSEYRKELYLRSFMTKEEKQDFKYNNPKNKKQKSWYRVGAISFLRNGRTTKTIALPANGELEILSAHRIKIQGLGVIQVVENLNVYKNKKITVSKIKLKDDGTFELQLVFKTKRKRKKIEKTLGADWNMANNDVFTTSDNNVYHIDDKIAQKADELEEKINELKSGRDTKMKHLSENSKRIFKINDEIQYLSAKRANIIKEEYIKIAHEIVSTTDLLALEKLDAKEMRKEKSEKNVLSKKYNKKLALIKPYELTRLIIAHAQRERKTVVLVDSYKTTKVHNKTNFPNDWLTLEDRVYVSKYDGAILYRDLNAARNIHDWTLDPKKHQKYFEYTEKLKKNKEEKNEKKIKEVKPQDLVEVY